MIARDGIDADDPTVDHAPTDRQLELMEADTVAIRRLIESSVDDDPKPPKLRADGQLDRRTRASWDFGAKAEASRRERQTDRSVHLIASSKFGDGRRTTCNRCAFVATGPTDEAMATEWNRHASAMKQRAKAARARQRATERARFD